MKRPTPIELLMLCTLLVGGCSTLENVAPEVLPTARYCSKVSYDRDEARDPADAVHFSAKCRSPFGGL